MIQLREIQTSCVEHRCEKDDGEADDEGDDGAGMMYRCAVCRRRGRGTVHRRGRERKAKAPKASDDVTTQHSSI